MLKRLASLSPGGWVILILALGSSAAVALWPLPRREGGQFWIFSLNHKAAYRQQIERWNVAHPENERFTPLIFSIPALERRLLSGFLSGTPVADLAEVEIGMIGKFFSGPLEAVGFVDLTDRLQQEGLLEAINRPSLAPWTSRGRIFGLPHDVHPVLLAYRADIVEAAGIDVSAVATWEDFVRVMSPLMKDANGDGVPDHYLLNIWETNLDAMEMLVLQAGGEFFDENQRPLLDSETNALVISTIVSWTAGPGRIGLNAPNFDAVGNQLFLRGDVLCNLMPDWLAGIWMQDLPGLKGKVKLMPLPAWSPGGRRTSVAGGTMLGIAKRSVQQENDWKFAKELYLSPELARQLFRVSAIISPVKANWADPMYAEPNPYFSGQANGLLYIAAAPDVPLRASSPYKSVARERMSDAVIRLKRHALQNGIFDVERLMPQARIELAVAQKEVLRRIEANPFLQQEGR